LAAFVEPGEVAALMNKAMQGLEKINNYQRFAWIDTPLDEIVPILQGNLTEMRSIAADTLAALRTHEATPAPGGDT
jgi:hypothetical protein